MPRSRQKGSNSFDQLSLDFSLDLNRTMNPLEWINDSLAVLERRSLRRHLPACVSRSEPEIEVDGRRVLSFASNDYLGLAADPRLARAAANACLEGGVGRGASPLICGRSPWHGRLEQLLAEFEGCDSALLFPSGYAANTGVIPALASRGDVIFSDAKNHASIVDGCRLARAETIVYPHLDCEELENRLRSVRSSRRRLIVTDTVFSMDGDLAPLPRLAELAERYDAMLMVDEAHATGVFGPTGRGVVEHYDAESTAGRLHDLVHVRIGTLSKALGSAGGFVAGSSQLIQWLANRCRSYVFSTAHPAAASAAAVGALDVVREEPGRRVDLLAAANRLREELRSQGWNVGQSTSQIVPLYVGSAKGALRVASQMLDKDLWVPAIRPPSVPAGESLLRISLTAAHTPEMTGRLVSALDFARENGNAAEV